MNQGSHRQILIQKVERVQFLPPKSLAKQLETKGDSDPPAHKMKKSGRNLSLTKKTPHKNTKNS
ncbi:MAG: hypothetical protein CM1200mP16_16720 [Nitrospina sp.]|nr:MAG: hypothetical protein CM1200mP16_16720 [Nitrospina sp.]